MYIHHNIWYKIASHRHAIEYSQLCAALAVSLKRKNIIRKNCNMLEPGKQNEKKTVQEESAWMETYSSPICLIRHIDELIPEIV